MRRLPALFATVAKPRIVAGLALFVTLAVATGAQAERRLFIVANNADGYGIDRCLASGASCGSSMATAYCRAREFSAALSYHKVDKDDITGAIPADASGACSHGVCNSDFVAIECSR